MEVFEYSAALERKVHVQTLHARGLNQTRIAVVLDVCRKTIQRDYKDLDLESWSTLSDADLCMHVLDIIETEHTAVGRRNIESYLVESGLRVQERRIKESLVSELSLSLYLCRSLSLCSSLANVTTCVVLFLPGVFAVGTGGSKTCEEAAFLCHSGAGLCLGARPK